MIIENPKNEYEKEMNTIFERNNVLARAGRINWISEKTALLFKIYDFLSIREQEELGDLFLKLFNKI